MAQQQRIIEKFDEQFGTMLKFRRRRPELKITEIISVRKDGSIHRTGRYLPPLPTEGNISKIFLKSSSEQEKAICYWWGRFMPDKKESIKSVSNAIMEEIQVSNEKSKDLLRIFSVLESYTWNDEEGRKEYYKSDAYMDYHSSNFEENRKRLEVRKKEQNKVGERKIEAKIQEVLEISTNISGKLQEELENNTHKIESQRLELKNLQKFFESEKVENATLKACLQEKLNQEERYKNTIVNLQEIYAEQIRKKGEEQEKEVLNLREHIGKLKLAYKEERKRRKRKKTQDTSSSSSSSESSSDSEAGTKKKNCPKVDKSMKRLRLFQVLPKK